ncbi:transposase [Cellulomonas sp. P24]|uniref:transposase n=1 Tax=Cellulomonas sp. P24 TaxID=2885206 RepID=UPI0037C1303D|nr:transposase [Cellulomonas sp. P24]
MACGSRPCRAGRLPSAPGRWTRARDVRRGYAPVVEVREGVRVVEITVAVAAGVKADGRRESLVAGLSTAEDGAGWLTYFRDPTARGATGATRVTSDARSRLVAVVGAPPPGNGARSHNGVSRMRSVPDALQAAGHHDAAECRERARCRRDERPV